VVGGKAWKKKPALLESGKWVGKREIGQRRRGKRRR
jgi:hypothetical protein